MATIHSFLPRPATPVCRDKAVVGSATIIIFPGIRHEPGKADGSGGGDSGTGGGAPRRRSAPGRR